MMDILAYCAVIGALFPRLLPLLIYWRLSEGIAADSGHAAHQSACGAAERSEGQGGTEEAAE